MPTDLDNAAVGGSELVFPGELTGFTWSLRDLAVYEAEEVQQSIDSDTPQYGRWLPAKKVAPGTRAHGDELWLNAPGELVEELQRAAERYDDMESAVFKITRCEKSGDHSTDPYEVNLERTDVEGSQESLGG